MNLIDGISFAESLAYHKDTGIGWFVQRFVYILYHKFLVLYKPVHTGANHTKTLLQGLLEGTADGHHLSYRLHTAAQLAGNTVELTKVPARNLTYHIVEGRFEEGRRCFGYRVFKIEKSVSQSQFGSHKGQRITGCFGSQGRRAAQTGIHLDYPVIFRIGVEGVLYVTFAHNTDVADDSDSQFAQFMIFGIGKCLGRSDNDTFAGMDSQGVEVFHITNRNTVVETVTYHFVFHLFPAFETLLHQYLG